MKSVALTKIEKMIYVVRGKKVMLDNDLADLYEVTTGNLNKAVARNIKRFPSDFVFELTQKEFEQILISKNEDLKTYGGRRKLPRAFTESGVAMLSGVLNSERAIKVNISIMRTFTKLRQLLASDETLTDKMHKIEEGTTKLFRVVFDRLDQIDDKINREVPSLSPTRKRIGLKTTKKKKS